MVTRWSIPRATPRQRLALAAWSVDVGRRPPPPRRRLRRGSPITQGNRAPGRDGGATSVLHARVARDVEGDLAVLLEWLSAEDLGEEFRRIFVGRHVVDGDFAGPTELPHLEELTIDVTRMLS